MRQQIVVLSGLHLLDYFTGRRRLANIPDGATLASWWIDVRRDGDSGLTAPRLHLRLEHESFAEVPAGARIPSVRARFALTEPRLEGAVKQIPDVGQSIVAAAGFPSACRIARKASA